MKFPLFLIILDGWGIAPPNKGNAVYLARTPFYDGLLRKYPNTQLTAHGKKVGLPRGQDGNSEAGHMNMGAGRIVRQDAEYINDSLKDGTFFKNTAFLESFKHIKKYKTSLHLMGLLTGINSAHAYPDHLYSLLDLAHRHGIKKVFIHLFTDGRDSSPHGALNYLEKLERKFYGNEKIATVMGRYYGMDRKKNWHNTKMAYEALILARGYASQTAREAILSAYNRGESDEFIRPTIITKDGKSAFTIRDNDAIIFFNLRSDRARQLTKVFVQPDFEKHNLGTFKRIKAPKNIRFAAMADFGPDLPGIFTAFPSRDIQSTLTIAMGEFRQLYISETEKYAHVTYFFNGGYADPVDGEDREVLLSLDIPDYSIMPEMKANELTERLLEVLKNNEYDVVVVNYPNPDMVGHTGDLKAGIKACEIIDKNLLGLIPRILDKNGVALITADHGNVEEMINFKTGEINTKHSTNPVPLILVGKKYTNKNTKLAKGILADVAVTILSILDIKKPSLMTGKSLIHKNGSSK